VQIDLGSVPKFVHGIRARGHALNHKPVKETEMRSRHAGSAILLATLCFGCAAAANAQGIQSAPTSPIAPGSSVPTTAFGAIGPANVPVAPGEPTSRSLSLERIGPGGRPTGAGSGRERRRVAGHELAGGPRHASEIAAATGNENSARQHGLDEGGSEKTWVSFASR